MRKVHNKVRKVHKILNILQSAQSAQSAFQKSCGVSIHRVFVAEFKNMVHFRQSAFLLIDKVRKVHRENHGGYQFTGFFLAEYKNMVHFRQSAFLQNDKVRKVHFY